MIPSGRLARLLLAVVFAGLIGLLDASLRNAAPVAAQAVCPVATSTPKATAEEQPQPLQWRALDKGHIPMPAATPAAHASFLLAMPASHASALTAFWFAGDRESAPNVQIAAAQWDRGAQRWSEARFVVNRHAMADMLGFGVRRLGNPVAWLDAQGRMHLFVVATGWGGWAAARILHLRQSSVGSDLQELAFAPERILPLAWWWNISTLVRNAPMPLADGGMVLPVHFELGIKYPIALRFDGSGNLTGMERMSQRRFILQPTLLAQSPSQWLGLMRDQRPNGRITAVQSKDGGATWRDLPDLALVNPDSATAGLALAPKQLLLVHNSAPGSREKIDLSTSADGAQWGLVDAMQRGRSGDEYSYPSMAWVDGQLWVSYTDDRRSIAWQRFEPLVTAKKGQP